MVEFSMSHELRVWLKDQPQDVAFVIAARCALRVQPFLARVFEADIPEPIQMVLFLDSFRAAHTSCVAAVFPRQAAFPYINAATTRAFAAYFKASTLKPGDYGDAFSYAELNAAKATNAVNAAHAANAAHAYDFLTAVNARKAAEAAADKITYFAHQSNDSPVNRNEDLGYCGAVANAAAAEAANAHYVAASAVVDLYDAGHTSIEGNDARNAVWKACSADCSNSEKMDATSLLALPVWPDGWPVWFETEMSKYLTRLESPEWEFWKRWYLGMLNGDSLEWAEQRKIANIPNMSWEAGPERIAGILKGAPVEQEPFLRTYSPPPPH
jgi:hypothetical protein